MVVDPCKASFLKEQPLLIPPRANRGFFVPVDSGFPYHQVDVSPGLGVGGDSGSVASAFEPVHHIFPGDIAALIGLQMLRMCSWFDVGCRPHRFMKGKTQS